MATGSVGDVDARAFARLLSGLMIEVVVGKGETRRKWNIHRTLLIHHSELLEEELGDESHEARLELPDHDPSGFELLVKWLYQGKLDDVSDISGQSQQYEHAVSCHKLYLLCERFGMEQLKNVAIDQYRRGLNLSELVPDPNEIDEVYRQSQPGSRWRKLMTQIAARQIMDPDSQRDAATYRECFESNPDFAIELVNAIKSGTGGMLLDDPTEPGNDCDYHDHESAPDCHIRGKGRLKQDPKTAPRPILKSSNSDPHVLSGRRPLLHLPPRLIPNPQPRRARRQDGPGTGPLRRRLTIPASSTTGMSTETAIMVAKSLSNRSSPAAQKSKRQTPTIPPARSLQSPSTENQPLVHGARPPSLGAKGHSTNNSSPNAASSQSTTRSGDLSDVPFKTSADDDSSRSIWDWTRLGRIGIISRRSEPPLTLMTSKAAISAVNGALQGSRDLEVSSGSLDDFSPFSSTHIISGASASQVHDLATSEELAGLGISSESVVAIDPVFFSQTKGSSDDLVAAASSMTGTPSPSAQRIRDLTLDDESDTSVPATPSPPARRKKTNVGKEKQKTTTRADDGNADSNNNSHPTERHNNHGKSTKDSKGHKTSSDSDQIPKYKIALASHILSPESRSSAP